MGKSSLFLTVNFLKQQCADVVWMCKFLDKLMIGYDIRIYLNLLMFGWIDVSMGWFITCADIWTCFTLQTDGAYGQLEDLGLWTEHMVS